MKYSLMTTSMVFPLVEKLHSGVEMETVKKEYADMLHMAAGCGIPAVEITSLQMDVFGLGFVKEKLSESGLACRCLIHMDQYAQTNEEQSKGIVERARGKVLDAGALGAKYMMLALMAQPDAEGQDRGQLQDALVRNIRPIAFYGKEHGITVSVEDTLGFYQNLKGRVVYVHLKDMEYTDQPDGADPALDGRYIRTVPHGKGVVDFQPILNTLRKDGYDG